MESQTLRTWKGRNGEKIGAVGFLYQSRNCFFFFVSSFVFLFGLSKRLVWRSFVFFIVVRAPVARCEFNTTPPLPISLLHSNSPSLALNPKFTHARSRSFAFLFMVQEGLFQALPFPVRITVMGGGNFGLALSLVLARNQVATV